MSTSDAEAPEHLYRPPRDGEEVAHAHSVRKVTPKQIYIDAVAEDGTTPQSMEEGRKHFELYRAEIKKHGSAYHGLTKTRFYRHRADAAN